MSAAEKARWLGYDRYREAVRKRLREKDRLEAEVGRRAKRKRPG